jgi:hypothetical protein
MLDGMGSREGGVGKLLAINYYLLPNSSGLTQFELLKRCRKLKYNPDTRQLLEVVKKRSHFPHMTNLAKLEWKKYPYENSRS